MKRSEKDKIIDQLTDLFGKKKAEKIKASILVMIEDAIEFHEEIYHGMED